MHLGSDLVHHAQPDAPKRPRASERRNQELAALFDWYRLHPHGGVSWRLVIAGDFIDFAGMSVPAELATETAPNKEERINGLGNARDHTLAKLQLVMAHDAIVMRSLAQFLAAGNSVVIVRGNHDVDWHWAEVQEEFRHGLSHYAMIAGDQIEFAPWFYYEEGVVFVEHGHQYDSYCSYEHLLHPVSPWDPKRTTRSLSEVLLRYIVRPTRGMTEAGHGSATLSDYLKFAYRLGTAGMLALLGRFVYATRALVSLWREHWSDAARWVRREHDAKMQLLSLAQKIHLDRLLGLARLHRPPVTHSLLAILASVMLDRVMLVSLGLVAVVACMLAIDGWALSVAASLTLLLLLTWLGAAWRALRHSIEPSAELRERSARIARLFPAAFVVMGHTHMPETRPASETTYVNLGAWGEEDSPEGVVPLLPATRTHLVLARVAEGPIAELLTWGQHGPEPFAKQSGESRILALFKHD